MNFLQIKKANVPASKILIKNKELSQKNSYKNKHLKVEIDPKLKNFSNSLKDKLENKKMGNKNKKKLYKKPKVITNLYLL